MGLLQDALQFSVATLCQFWHTTIVVTEKPEQPRKLVWLVDTLERLKCFPPSVQQRLGFALYQAQIGKKHESAKILHGFAETVWQVRADDQGGTYRAVYIAQFHGAVYVLHAFQKKAKSGISTSQMEVELIRKRLQRALKLAGIKGD